MPAPRENKQAAIFMLGFIGLPVLGGILTACGLLIPGAILCGIWLAYWIVAAFVGAFRFFCGDYG